MKEADEKYHILVVDDDDRLRKLLFKYLKDNHFDVSVAQDAAQAREQMKRFIFDLLIVDVMMPVETGVAFTQSLRAQNNTTPVLMLTAMGAIDDRISGLESGADDYLTKPFDPKELLLRIQSILRRSELKSPQKKGVLKFGEVEYRLDRGELFQNGELVVLTSVEAVLLRFLAQKAGQEVSREELGELTHNDNLRTIDVQITRLRRKLENDAKAPRYLQTVRGKGYILLPD